MRHTFRAAHNLTDFVGQSRHVTRRHHILCRQQFRDAARCGANARQTSRHGLNHCPGQTFLMGWQYEKIGSIQLSTHSFSGR
jgi:hypothetical protein